MVECGEKNRLLDEFSLHRVDLRIEHLAGRASVRPEHQSDDLGFDWFGSGGKARNTDEGNSGEGCFQ